MPLASRAHASTSRRQLNSFKGATKFPSLQARVDVCLKFLRIVRALRPSQPCFCAAGTPLSAVGDLDLTDGFADVAALSAAIKSVTPAILDRMVMGSDAQCVMHKITASDIASARSCGQFVAQVRDPETTSAHTSACRRRQGDDLCHDPEAGWLDSEASSDDDVVKPKKHAKAKANTLKSKGNKESKANKKKAKADSSDDASSAESSDDASESSNDPSNSDASDEDGGRVQHPLSLPQAAFLTAIPTPQRAVGVADVLA